LGSEVIGLALEGAVSDSEGLLQKGMGAVIFILEFSGVRAWRPLCWKLSF